MLFLIHNDSFWMILVLEFIEFMFGMIFYVRIDYREVFVIINTSGATKSQVKNIFEGSISREYILS